MCGFKQDWGVRGGGFTHCRISCHARPLSHPFSVLWIYFASFLKFSKRSPCPPVFCPLLEGNTNTFALYNNSFCKPNLHFLCANCSYTIFPLNAITRGVYSSSFCDKTIRPS